DGRNRRGGDVDRGRPEPRRYRNRRWRRVRVDQRLEFGHAGQGRQGEEDDPYQADARVAPTRAAQGHDAPDSERIVRGELLRQGAGVLRRASVSLAPPPG